MMYYKHDGKLVALVTAEVMCFDVENDCYEQVIFYFKDGTSKTYWGEDMPFEEAFEYHAEVVEDLKYHYFNVEDMHDVNDETGDDFIHVLDYLNDLDESEYIDWESIKKEK